MSLSTMKAVKVVGVDHAEIQEVPIPQPQSHEILVKISCVALNPLDWKIDLAMMPVVGATLGCDFSGTVAAVGSETKKPWTMGDRVLGWIVGNNIARKDNGAFAEYCVADAELCVRIPEDMTDEEAASPPAGFATAGIGVFQKHGLPLPGEEKAASDGETILVYGGTSATGTLAIQMAKLAGLNVLTTCSTGNNDRLKALGATEAFNYKDASCGQKIRDYTKDSLTKIFDTISEGSSVAICSAAMSSSGGVVSTTLPWPEERERKEDIEARMLFTLGIFGEPVGYGEQTIPANADDHEYAKHLYAVAEKLLQGDKLKVHPPKVCKPGLEGVFDAIEVAKAGKGSGVKLVVRL